MNSLATPVFIKLYGVTNIENVLSKFTQASNKILSSLRRKGMEKTCFIYRYQGDTEFKKQIHKYISVPLLQHGYLSYVDMWNSSKEIF